MYRMRRLEGRQVGRQVGFWLGIQEIYQRPKPSVVELLRRLALVAIVFTLKFISKWLEKLRYRLHNRPYKRLELSGETQCLQLQSRLLALPAEIRLIIWKHIMTNHRIVLFRRNGRIAYDCLTTEYPEPVGNITSKIIKQLEDGTVCPSRCEKTRFLAVLQTCQMMYLETIDLLYTANTFMCLQNTVFSDFSDSPDLITLANISKIRSLHLHFQFGESVDHCGFDRELYANSHFNQTFTRIPQYLPNIRNLSIFIQGPIIGYRTLSYIISHITSLCHKIGPSAHVVVRLPRIEHGRYRHRWPHYWPAVERSTQGTLDRPDFPFQRVQPVTKNRSDAGLISDAKTKHDCSWRVGTFYIKENGNIEDMRTMNYAVFTEENSSSLKP